MVEVYLHSVALLVIGTKRDYSNSSCLRRRRKLYLKCVISSDGAEEAMESVMRLITA